MGSNFLTIPFFVMSSIIVTSAFRVNRGTCKNRCLASFDRSQSCQCNVGCEKFRNCCSDYRSVCTRAKPASDNNQNCPTLKTISKELWDSDVNSLTGNDLKVNFQSKVPDFSNKDLANTRLFTHVKEAKPNGDTYRAFIALLNNYDPVKGKKEFATARERQEENTFLESILSTTVMNKLLSYLMCKGLVSNRRDLKASLQKIWFDTYRRSRWSKVPDTSGFEHVMQGEYKDKKTVSGFHSWVSFYLKEKAGEIDYYGYVSKTKMEPSIIGAAFNWNHRYKAKGSFFIGSSPEFDIAIYSLCFLLRPGENCRVVLGGRPIGIKTFDSDGHIATAFIRY